MSNQPSTATSEFNHRLIVSLVLTVTFVAIFGCDLYIPSLPSITKMLNTTDSLTQFTITLYFLGMGCTQIIYGPCSDRFGRRPVLLIGLTIGLIGSLICLSATHINTLLIGRFIQGAGAAAGFSVARAIYSDLFQGEKLSRVGSYIGLIISLAPAIAPALGGYLQEEYGWRANFLVMGLSFTAVMISTTLLLPETHLKLNAHALKFTILKQTFHYLLTHPKYLAAAFASSITFSGIIIYYSLSAYLYQNLLSVSPFGNGLLTTAIAFGFGVGHLANLYWVKKMGTTNMVVIGSCLMMIGSLIMLFFAYLEHFYVLALVGPMTLFVIGSSCIQANSNAIAMNAARHIAGSASALFGTLQMAATFVMSAIAAYVPNGSAWSLALLLCAISILALMASKVLRG